MKHALIYLAIFGMTITSVVLLISATQGPDENLVGSWVEVDWEYEKVDAYHDEYDASRKQIPEFIKQSIGEQLIIHESETWTFQPDGTLLLDKGDEILKVNWYLKGRGNILKIKYDNRYPEYYEVAHVDETTLIIHLETEVQVRGIAKLTFKRIS